eukprot:CAMPEP_0174384168 /NCGR_PEP_ID=MMETSP0811_2-20130205/125740_1 /TAXON_ID=73025 ORGANISM="Eutreptiella gymnastica-like, Strain CCMP1594" /NCGR_SAMPLE_ID=MMETSP0811_2 /ASSEMBLY_ACC=CAM_ASM_000667 /LENGTH=81 /DNA_ID=CAMNT_0015538041 /DNA_START=1638 /DNA_END=1883 /DNA_ORIENTATION=-
MSLACPVFVSVANPNNLEKAPKGLQAAGQRMGSQRPTMKLNADQNRTRPQPGKHIRPRRNQLNSSFDRGERSVGLQCGSML